MKEVKAEWRFLLDVCAKVVNGKEVTVTLEQVNNLDFKSLIKESIYQGLPLAFFSVSDKFKQLIDVEDFSYWLSAISPYLSSNLRNLQIQKNLVDILEQGGYKYAILKGTSVAKDYCEPSMRALGDVDFLIEKNQVKNVEKLLTDNGFILKSELNENHVSFVKNGQVAELHFSPVHIPKGKIGKIISDELSNWLEEIGLAKYEDCSFKMFDKYRQGIVILIHMQHHMTTAGIGLRHLCDWASYINNADQETQARLVKFFKKTGLFVYASTITKTCAKYLGISLPKWAENADDKLCLEVLEDIFAGGNFGVKDKERSNSGVLIVNEDGKSKNGGKKELLKKLHNSVMKRYPFLKYLFILYPFFFAFRVLRYALLVLMGKRSKISKLTKLAEERNELYEKLRIYDIE